MTIFTLSCSGGTGCRRSPSWSDTTSYPDSAPGWSGTADNRRVPTDPPPAVVSARSDRAPAGWRYSGSKGCRRSRRQLRSLHDDRDRHPAGERRCSLCNAGTDGKTVSG